MVSTQSDSEEVGEVTLFLDGDDLYLHGAPEAIDLVLADVLEANDPNRRRGSRTRMTEAAAVAASAVALGSTAQELLRPTAESLEKIRSMGAQVDASGALRGFVRNGAGQFGGQLAFETVSFGAEQALAMQTAAVALALRSAIGDVEKAVDEVKAKVSDLQRRMRSTTVGDVVGTYRHLHRVVEDTRRRGFLLAVDWDQTAYASRDLKVSLEELRDYVSKTMQAAGDAGNLAKRKKAIEELGDQEGVAASLRLILVAEQALHLQQYLRIERVRSSEPEHLDSALVDARASLQEQRDLNAKLVRDVAEQLESAKDIDPLEVHRLISINALPHVLDQALTELNSFASAARVPSPDLDAEVSRPALTETRDELRRQAVGAAREAASVSKTVGRRASVEAKRAKDRVRRRRSTDVTKE